MKELDQQLAQALQMAIISGCYPDAAVKEAKHVIEEGSKVAFDLRVGLKGILTRGSGFTVKPTSALLSKAVLARLLRHLGATRESAKMALLRAAEEGLVTGQPTSDVLARERELLLAIDEVDQDLLQKLPRVPRSGSIRVAAGITCSRSKLELLG